MKILFQGGWKAGRDPEGIRDTIASYCRSLATFIVKPGHTVVLTSYRDFDKLIATEVVIASKAVSGNIKDHLLFLLPERVNSCRQKVVSFSSTSRVGGLKSVPTQCCIATL
jgi:hypothetical protein